MSRTPTRSPRLPPATGRVPLHEDRLRVDEVARAEFLGALGVAGDGGVVGVHADRDLSGERRLHRGLAVRVGHRRDGLKLGNEAAELHAVPEAHRVERLAHMASPVTASTAATTASY